MRFSITNSTIATGRKTLAGAAASALLALTASTGAHAQVSLTNLANVYTQDFNTLTTTGTVAYADGLVPGLFARQSIGTLSTYRAGDGSSNAGALYSFGTGTTTDRALGSVASGTPGNFQYGFYFTNNGTATITSFTLAYTGEQWRNGGVAATQSLAFDYGIFNAGVTGATAVAATTGYTAVTGLNFVSPTTSTTAAALDGNLAANRTLKNQTVTLTTPVAVGQSVFIRFTDLDDAGADHGLAVDDLTFTAGFSGPAAAAPEPGTLALLGTYAVPGMGLLAARRRRTKKAA